MKFVHILLPIAVLLATPAAGQPAGAAAPAVLKVEYAAQPLGLDRAAPAAGVAFAGCRGRPPIAFASRRRPPIWSARRSGTAARSSRADNVQIAYAGPKLASRQRYWWQVQVWDADGSVTGWSAPAWWEMGLLGASDWPAQWISGPEQPRP